MKAITRQTFVFHRKGENDSVEERFTLALTATPVTVPDWVVDDPTWAAGLRAGLIDLFDERGPQRLEA